MKKENKTNAARLLDKAGITYELNSYDVDEDDLSAVHVAETLGLDVKAIFKTLVLRGDKNGVFVCVVPGDGEVDLKKAAKASGNKKAEMVAMKELLPLTGYIRGGCSPIGMKKRYPAYVEPNALDRHHIYISAGIRGMQIKIAPQDLIEFMELKVADLIVDQ